MAMRHRCAKEFEWNSTGSGREWPQRVAAGDALVACSAAASNHHGNEATDTRADEPKQPQAEYEHRDGVDAD